MEAASEWGDIASDIDIVCKSSNVGAKMFGHFQALRAQDVIKKEADRVLATLTSVAPAGKKLLEESLTKIVIDLAPGRPSRTGASWS